VRLPGAGVDIEAYVYEVQANAPTVILVHGYGGSARDMLIPARLLAEAGYRAVPMSMRGWGRSAGNDDLGLVQPDDVSAIASWCHETATGSVGVLGISQGGQVALLAASRGADVQAVVAWSAPTDIALWKATTSFRPGIPDYIDALCRDGQLEERSPRCVARRIAAPVLLVHGDADTRVPTAQSVVLHDALFAAGRDSTLELLPGVEHRRGEDGNRQAFALTIAFFDRHLH